MPFGLKNATQIFQRLMDTVLRGLPFAFCYIDDIIIMSDSPQEHREHLQTVFTRLREFGLKINLAKCVFGVEEIKFIGYTINKTGTKPPTDRVSAILECPKPQTIVELRRFLGLINYYRRSIPHAAHLQAPLNEFLKNSCKNDKRKVPWTLEAEEAFVSCKQSLANTTMLFHLIHDAPLALVTDASDIAVGAKLE